MSAELMWIRCFISFIFFFFLHSSLSLAQKWWQMYWLSFCFQFTQGSSILTMIYFWLQLRINLRQLAYIYWTCLETDIYRKHGSGKCQMPPEFFLHWKVLQLQNSVSLANRMEFFWNNAKSHEVYTWV